MNKIYESNALIVAGGGWLTRQIVGRPKTRFFCFLSVVWLGVSICASYPFWHGWPESFGALEWVCGLLLVPQPVLVILAFVFLLTEQPCTITEQRPNPDRDIGKLY
jgi:hypothetical protein